jgi:hypothetical protein
LKPKQAKVGVRARTHATVCTRAQGFERLRITFSIVCRPQLRKYLEAIKKFKNLGIEPMKNANLTHIDTVLRVIWVFFYPLFD